MISLKMIVTAWIIEHIKKAVTVLVESKNKMVQIKEKLIVMFLRKQYYNNPVNKYVTHFKTNVKSVNMAGEENVLDDELVMDR